MYRLTSTPPGGGRVTEHGQWPTLKMATLVARAIQDADPDTARSFSANPDDRGVSIMVPLTPPTYHPDEQYEVTLSDGSVHWTDDLERSFALANALLADDTYKFSGDLVYALTTNNSGELWLENDGGVVLKRKGPDCDDPEAFASCVANMMRDAEARA